MSEKPMFAFAECCELGECCTCCDLAQELRAEVERLTKEQSDDAAAEAMVNRKLREQAEEIARLRTALVHFGSGHYLCRGCYHFAAERERLVHTEFCWVAPLLGEGKPT